MATKYISKIKVPNVTDAYIIKDANAIPKSIGTTAGDIIYWSAANTPARLGKGTNGQVLTLVNGVPAWAAAGGISNNLVLKIKSGTTEGTNLYTYNGSAAKTLDFKQGSNITLTAASGAVTIAATNTNYYPTAFSWTNGTTSGPTGSLTGSGMSAVSFGAIPSASTSTSGILTTGAQDIAGTKTFYGTSNGVAFRYSSSTTALKWTMRSNGSLSLTL